jgi:ribosomal-protein-serine acetyltransferase
MTTPIIEGNGLRIRPYGPEDAVRLYDAARASWQDTVAFMPWCHQDYALEHAQAWVAGQADAWMAGTEYSFLAETIPTADHPVPEYLGGLGINNIDREYRMCNLGYWTSSRHRGQGVARRAVPLLMQWAFREQEMVRIEIVVAVHNVPSLRVAKAVGAHEEGTLRDRLILHGVSYDAVMSSVTRKDAIARGWL